MYGLGIILVIIGIVVMMVAIFDEDEFDETSTGILIAGFVILFAGAGIISNINSKNPVYIQQNKHEELQREIQRISSEKTKWKYYNSLKKKNKALEKKLKQLKSEN